MPEPIGTLLRIPRNAVSQMLNITAVPFAIFNIGGVTTGVNAVRKRKSFAIQNRDTVVKEISFGQTTNGILLRAETILGDGNGGYFEASLNEDVQVWIVAGLGNITVIQVGE
jgi:hypothetical protein